MTTGRPAAPATKPAPLLPETCDLRGTTPAKRRNLIAARQALDVIERQAMLTWSAAFNLMNGHALTAGDLVRLAAAIEPMRGCIVRVAGR